MSVSIQLPNKSLPYHHEDYPGSLRIGLTATGRVQHRFPPISHGSRPLPSISTSTAAVPEPAERRLLPAAGAAPAARPLLLQVQLPRLEDENIKAMSPHQRLVVGCTYNFQTLPEEHGSCRVNADCTQRVSPYCSGFGYCTQITQYGQGGCSPCEGNHYHQR